MILKHLAKKYIILFLIVCTLGVSGLFSHTFLIQTNAAAYIWDGGGSDNNWSTCANWNPDVCPTSADTITFNATSTKNATIDVAFGGSVSTVTIGSGYTGTITMARSLTVSSGFTTSGGTFNSSDQILTVSGTFTMNTGSTFTASSSTTNFNGALTINGGTFNHNNGIVNFGGTGSKSLGCNNILFNSVTLTPTSGTITINNSCSLPLGSNPTISSSGNITLNGTLSGSGKLTKGGNTFTINSNGVLSGFNNLSLTNFTVAGATLNLSSYTAFTTSATLTLSSGILTLPDGADLNGALVISGGTFNAPSGSLRLAGNLTISGTPVFNHNNGTIIFDGTTNATLTCNNVAFNQISFANTNNAKNVTSTCTLPVGNNPIFTTAGNITLAGGKITGSGTYTQSSTLAITSGSQNITGFDTLAINTLNINGADIDLSSYSIINITGTTNLISGSLNLPSDSSFTGIFNFSGGTFTAPAGNLNISNNFTISNSATFNANSGTITFNEGDATLICNNAVFNSVIVNATGTKTIESDCDFNIGNNPNVTRIILSGTLRGTGTLHFTSAHANTFYTGYQLIGFDDVTYANINPNTISITRLLNTNQGTYYQTNSGASPKTYVGAWALASSGNKLFTGWSKSVPEYVNNNTFLSYYDSNTQSFTKIMDIPEQDIDKIKVFGDTLYIPGIDPNAHGWDAGDLITVDINTLTSNIMTYRYDTEHFVDATTTDSNGNYSFTNLKNTAYILKVIKPADYALATAFKETASGYPAGYFDNMKDNNFDNSTSTYTQCKGNGDGATGDIGVNLGEPYVDDTIDAGLISSPGAPGDTPNNQTRDDSYFNGDVTLGDKVWLDSNGNSLQDDGESGVANVRIELYTKDPYFPCAIHSDGIFKDTDGTLYVDYAYTKKPEDITHLDIPSVVYYNAYLSLLANVLVRSEDNGNEWTVVDKSIYTDGDTKLGYFASDITKTDGYFYRNISLQGYSRVSAVNDPDIPGNTIRNLIYPTIWSYSSNGVDWFTSKFEGGDIGYTEVVGGGTITQNYIINPTEQYSTLIPFRGGVVLPSTYPNKLIKLNGANHQEITTSVSVFNDILPSYKNSINTAQDNISGAGQRYNSIKSVQNEYIYAIGSDNRLYLSTDLRNWKDIADFNEVDSGSQMIALNYWSDKNNLVVATTGTSGSIYTINHSDIVNNYLRKILNSNNLSFQDEYEPTLDLKNIGTVSGDTPVLIKKNDLLLSKVTATFQDNNLNWNNVKGESDPESGKAYIANLTSSEGAGNTHTLYVPIANGNNPDKFLLCPNATSLSDINSSCSNAVVFSEGDTKNINGSSVTVSKETIDSVTYWKAIGVRGTGGMSYIPSPSSTSDNSSNSNYGRDSSEGLEENNDDDIGLPPSSYPLSYPSEYPKEIDENFPIPNDIVIGNGFSFIDLIVLTICCVVLILILIIFFLSRRKKRTS